MTKILITGPDAATKTKIALVLRQVLLDLGWSYTVRDGPGTFGRKADGVPHVDVTTVPPERPTYYLLQEHGDDLSEARLFYGEDAVRLALIERLAEYESDLFEDDVDERARCAVEREEIRTWHGGPFVLHEETDYPVHVVTVEVS